MSTRIRIVNCNVSRMTQTSKRRWRYTRNQNFQSPKSPNFIEQSMASADVFSTLERIQLSSPKFTMLCASMARASKINLEECVLLTSTVARRKVSHRDTITTIVKDGFSSTIKSGLVVHFDGKKLKDTTNEDKKFRNKLVERIAVVVAGIDTEKIVTVAKAENGK